MRILPILAVAAALTACATTAPEPPPPGRAEPARAWSAQEARALAERDAAEVLGADAIVELRRSSTSVLVRRPVPFPRMIPQPDGSFRPEPANVAAAIRATEGWILWTGQGRFALDPHAARELDRLIGTRALWREPELGETGCTDPAGFTAVLRQQGQTRVSTQPCGAHGLTGQLASIVLAGRVTDWSAVPPDDRPDGLAFTRFHPGAERYFQFASGIREPLNLVVRDIRTWEAMWRRITASHGEPPPPPEIMFGREMLLIAAMGPQPSGGYRIRIERILDEGDALEAHVVHTSPGPRCGAIAAITHPVDVVRIADTDKPVRWLIRRDVSECP